MQSKYKRLTELREDAATIFKQGIKAVEPGEAIHKYCRCEDGFLYAGTRQYDLSRIERIFIIGAGKAAAPMAAGMEELLEGRISKGHVNVKYDHIARLKHVAMMEAGHPVPDEKGHRGTERILQIAKTARKNDLVICLISGGGSALMPLPAKGLTLEDKQETIITLMSCGASIHEINAVRKHTSGIKGGRLAMAARPAQLITLILSDVVGDDLDVIASGPTVPDSSTFTDCRDIFEKYDIMQRLPRAVTRHIDSGISQKTAESPKPGSAAFENTNNLIIGSNIEAINAAQMKAQNLGYNTIILSSMIEGETREVAAVHGAIAKEIHKSGNPLEAPACVLSGGETTVTLHGDGLGGRNQEFALAVARDICGIGKTVVLSGGTDGTDGMTEAAGAIADNETVKRAHALGLDPIHYLRNNDSYHFFKKLGDLLVTGPTNTNVMDLRIVLAAEKP